VPVSAATDRRIDSRRKRPTVLLVEDNLDQLDLYALLLETSVDVLRASRGEAAYALACAERPDVIVLDLLLPDVSGFVISRRLRGTEATAKIPIIFLTGDEDSYFKALSSPEYAVVFDVLKKPCPAERLLSVIAAAAERRPES